MIYEDLKYLAVGLPEDIEKEKWSGNFDKARKLIQRRLEENLPYPLSCRLELEIENLWHLESCYTVSREEALVQVREHIPDLTDEALDNLQAQGKIDWIYLNGKTMYLDSFCATLFKVYPDMWQRSVLGDKSDYGVLDELISDLTDGQEIACHIHIRQELSVADDALEEGKTIRVHIPMPKEREQIRKLNIIQITPSPKSISPDTAHQPTVYFEEVASVGQVFSVEYAFDHVTRYVDLSKADLSAVEAAPLPKETEKFLIESYPHIQFTPYLQALATELRGKETNPLLIARRFYDYITTETDYRFVRDYACIDNLPEYCALNRKGDCGLQALLFITLCRISGIPAKWQSGLDAKPGDVGEHDWAMFYVPSIGWVYADLSYGGSSYIRGALKRWNYFFGNADPYRIPINSEFQRQVDPPKKYWRADPYDNQCGEIEYDHRGLRSAEMNCHYKESHIYRIK